MRRHAIGAISLISLFIVGFIYFTQGYAGLNNFFAAMSLRLGITMGALWLGLPDLDQMFAKYPPWVFVLGIVVMLMLVANGKVFPIAISLVVIAIGIQFFSRILQPASSRTNRTNQTSESKKKN